MSYLDEKPDHEPLGPEEGERFGEDEEHDYALDDADDDEKDDVDEGASGHWEDEREPGEGRHWTPQRQERPRDGTITKVALDWVELEGALENNSPELHSFLNIATGDVIRIFEGSENAEQRLKQAESSPDFLYIEPISSREQYRWMEEFIEIVEDPPLKEKLNIAIDGKGAFRRFKDVLVGYPAEREHWFGKRSEKLRAHMVEWLTSKNVQATNTPPWEGGEERAHHHDETRRNRTAEFDARSWREGAADLRALAHEMLDLIPSRELPMAVTFLEFLRGRRNYRRNSGSGSGSGSSGGGRY